MSGHRAMEAGAARKKSTAAMAEGKRDVWVEAPQQMFAALADDPQQGARAWGPSWRWAWPKWSAPRSARAIDARGKINTLIRGWTRRIKSSRAGFFDEAEFNVFRSAAKQGRSDYASTTSFL